MNPLPKTTFYQKDALSESFKADLIEDLGDNKISVAISDICPNLSGVKFADHVKSIELVKIVWHFCQPLLKPKGSFLCKILVGGEEIDFKNSLERLFEKVRWIKPDASRKSSREIYLLASKFIANQV